MSKAVIINNKLVNTKSIDQTNYPITKITYGKPTIKIEDIVPFRVKFTTIGIPPYSPSNPAPIGIAVIGLNNYIL